MACNPIKTHYCLYNKCLNKTDAKRTLSFFRFPVKNPERAELWRRNSGNRRLDKLKLSELANKCLCERHFPLKYFSINQDRKLLVGHAVPFEYIDEPEPVPMVDVFDQATQQAHSEYEEITIEEHEIKVELDEEGEMQLIKKIKTEVEDDADTVETKPYFGEPTPNLPKVYPRSLPTTKVYPGRRKLISKSAQTPSSWKVLEDRRDLVKPMRRKKRQFSNGLALHGLLKNKSANVQTLVVMQLLAKNRSKYSRAEKRLALSLYKKSPKYYKFMLESLHFNLPSIKIVKSWMV